MAKIDQLFFLVKRKFPAYSKGMSSFIFLTRMKLNCVVTSQQFVQRFWDKYKAELEYIADDIDMTESTPEVLDAVRQFIVETQEYREFLKELPDEEFVELYRKEKLARRGRQETLASNSDKWRFFNEPEADANLEHWAGYAGWTAEEATSLSFGKEPSIVNSVTLTRKLAKQYSLFARDFRRRKQRVLRAMAVGDLEKLVPPTAFLEWARNEGISLPPRLVDLVGPTLTIWKDRCYELEAEIEALKFELERFRGQDLSTNERKSLLKIVLVMAVAKFGYSPGMRTSAAKVIASNSQKNPELQISEDTAKKWLDQAASELDFQPEAKPQ